MGILPSMTTPILNLDLDVRLIAEGYIPLLSTVYIDFFCLKTALSPSKDPSLELALPKKLVCKLANEQV